MFIEKYNMNTRMNSFDTIEGYQTYLAGEGVAFPNFAYLVETDSLAVIGEEHVPVFSLMVTDQWGTEYSDGGTIEGDGDQNYLYVYGYLDGQQISSDDFSLTANNGLVFSDGITYYQAELPYGYGSTYNYTITATCGEQTVTFSLAYVQPETPAVGLSLVLSFCQDLSDGDWCITQGFCDDSDYYILLMNGDIVQDYGGEVVSYVCRGNVIQPTLVDNGKAIWHVEEFDSSISSINCTMGDGQVIVLDTSC